MRFNANKCISKLSIDTCPDGHFGRDEQIGGKIYGQFLIANKSDPMDVHFVVTQSSRGGMGGTPLKGIS